MRKPYHRLWQKKRRQKLKSEGLCTICGKEKPKENKIRCEFCSKKANKSVHKCAKKRKIRFLELKLCCCGRQPRPNKKTCEICNKKNKNNYQKRKTNGLCSYCNELALPGKTRCVNCSKKHSEQRQLLKMEVFNAYGGPICTCCKEDNIKFLTLDHANNDGKQHRARLRTTSVLKWLKLNGFPKGFQVLCFNCNLGRQLNNNICPHQECKVGINSTIFTNKG
jgi:hypothetical protein